MLLKELLHIPDGVYQGDFVLKLTEGVGKAQETLDSYVVTPELALCFDQALGLVQSAVTGRTSKATYLHGSFGSGKSHFMAILHLILHGNPQARSIPELAAVIQKHAGWLQGKKFLLVPYHMIGMADIESGILGQYVNHLRQLHPEAPPPAVSQLGPLLINVQKEREEYGDAAFFKRLNRKVADTTAGPGWGQVQGAEDADGAYNATSFARAAQSGAGSVAHTALVTRLLETVAQGQIDSMARRQGQYVNLDVGLSEISRHAQSLGYDAVVLFLDELILWLASRSAESSFVHEQASKLTNLVEAQSADRPIPLISFVARQRDLRELVGEQVTGAEQLSFAQSLDWQQGRFTTITLEDRNLPAIVEKRVLIAKDAAAVAQMDQAFSQAQRQLKQHEKDILITQDFDLQAFRKLYPFSPALIEALIAISSVLQRERTALRVLLNLLYKQRDTLELGQFIPVGDLLDEVNDGTTALMPAMARRFENANKLYVGKLLPMLEQNHAIRREEALLLPQGDPRRSGFVADDRLVKTLLLSALVPEVRVLKDLTAERLVTLNYGSIRAPIPGREAQMALTRVRAWAAQVAEITVQEGPNPRIGIRISGVDTQSILDQVQNEDNHGNRLRLVRTLLIEGLNVRQEGEQELTHPFWYRHTARQATLLFRNIRELPPSSLENSEPDWKVIIDFPFDEEGHTPDEDKRVMRQFLDQHKSGARTLCWMPSFLGVQALQELGTLVRLRNILASGDKFESLATHLSVQDRLVAREQLEGQRNNLEKRIGGHLLAAYGLGKPDTGVLASMTLLEPADHFQSLYPGFELRVPSAANLGGALLALLYQAMEFEFPAAPDFLTDVKPAVIRKVYELIQPATQRPDGRQPIEKSDRKLLHDIANPLKLGEMNMDSNMFVQGDYWRGKFERKIAPGIAPGVRELRGWMDEPKKMGLDTDTQNLIIRLFADQTNRIVMRHGVPAEGLKNLADDCVLQSFRLPTEALWLEAQRRAGAIFGLASDRQTVGLTARAVTWLRDELQKKARAAVVTCRDYASELRLRWLAQSGAELPAATPQWPVRLQSAQATLDLCQQLAGCSQEETLEELVRARVCSSETAMGSCVSQAGEWAAVLRTTSWDLIEAAGKLSDARQEAGQRLLQQVRQALSLDNQAIDLAPTLQMAQKEALKQITWKEKPVIVLPTEVVWREAQRRAGVIFGLASARQAVGLTAQAVTGLQDELQKKARAVAWACRDHVGELCRRWQALSGKELPAATLQWPAGLQSAQATLDLCQQLESGDPKKALEVLVGAPIATSETAMGACVSRAGEWATVLRTTRWDQIEAAGKLRDARQEAGQHLLEQVRQALSRDNQGTDLADTLKAAQQAAQELLTAVVLPTEVVWREAQRRAGVIFGLASARQAVGLTAQAVTGLQDELQKKARAVAWACRDHVGELCRRWQALSGKELPAATLQWPAGLQSAQATLDLCQQLESGDPKKALEVLVGAPIATSETAMGACVSRAGEWATVLRTTRWDQIEAAGKLRDARQEAGQHLLEQVRQALSRDNQGTDLADTLKAAQQAAQELLTVIPPPPPPAKTGRREGLNEDTVAALVRELRGKVPPGGTLTMTIDWIIAEGGA